MAYESQTYEVIIHRMMDRISANYPNLDTREGSVLFNAVAAAAIELAISYVELDNTRNQSFVETASREYILLGCRQIGMDTSVFDATAGVHKGLFNVEVSIGSRWNYDLYNYEVTEYMGVENGYHAYRLQCETIGSTPNTAMGDLTPITEIPVGLSYSKLAECLINGEDEASDEDIKTAYYDYVNNVRSDGNVGQYQQWCSEYPGIGNAKIFPLWNGSNTVKVSILSASNGKASDELVAEFQEYLDPGVTGMGDGIAPIGAFVTVTTATETPINISANITLKSTQTNTSMIETALRNYLASIAYEKTMVAYMNIGAIILGVDGVESVTNVKINGGTSDILLGEEAIPVLGTTSWTVT